MNAIMIIHPYWKNNTWCFTDEAKGLKDEPFVVGADTLISMLLEEKGILKTSKEGFNMIFSETFFPDYDVMVTHISVDDHKVGNWYKYEEKNFNFWLCPALLKYFKHAPKQIYAKLVESTDI